MSKLEVYYDYTCPHCLRGHQYLLELLPHYADIEVEWHPCEAHPRPESHGRHSDLCARGLYFAEEKEVNLTEYHRRMYQAALTDRADIEKANVLTEIMKDLLNADEFEQALSGSLYTDSLLENNRLAWETYDFPAVPSFRMNGKLLKSRLGVGVTKAELADFLGQK